MRFNSLTFVIFLALVLAIHRLPIGWRLKKVNLLLASYLFYAAWNPPFVILIWISTIVDWYVAGALARIGDQRRRRLLLFVSLGTNLGLLGFFKYGTFLLDNFISLVALVGIEYRPPDMGIVLPVGISFYTFQTLSYTIDVYRRELKPSKSFLDFALFVTFFPQLVAGPIVRAGHFLPQLLRPIKATSNQIGWGLCLLTIGLFEKVVLADEFVAPVADTVFNSVARAGFVDAWIGTLAFSAQIFFDFAGYSTCAIGAALCFGIALPDNFRSPYAAIGFSDFWRRWHISLSTWLRDYLYVPLGGNRSGRRRTAINLVVTMLLGGLWHGAAWRFVAWGGLHGVYLGAERWLKKVYGTQEWTRAVATQIAIAVLTYGLVCIAWVFFRAQTFGDAATLLQAMVGLAEGELLVGRGAALIVAGVTVGTLVGQWIFRMSTIEDVWRGRSSFVRAVVIAAMIVGIVISSGEDRAFIYFQF